MKLETPLITMILMSIVFIGLFTIFTSLADDYDVSYNMAVFETQDGTSLQDAFDRINQSKSEIVVIQEDFSSEDTSRETSSLFTFLSLGYRTGKALLNSLTLFDDILYITAELLGIDSTIIAGLTAIIMVCLLYTSPSPRDRS